MDSPLAAQIASSPHLLPRIFALFDQHRARIAIVTILVLFGAGISVLPPLITQRIFDDALFVSGGPRLRLLALLVSGMVLLIVLTNLANLVQTRVMARVGASVVGALRVRLYAHLQTLDLGFFTRTKAGAIQSRLHNDVGGVAYALSSSLPSVLGNVVVVSSALVAMFVLSWQLSLIAIALLPFVLYAQRRVGAARVKIVIRTQDSFAEMASISQEGLSASGVLLSKTYDRQQYEIDRFSKQNEEQVDLDVREQMSGQWFFSTVNITFAAMPPVLYLAAGFLMSDGLDGITAGTLVAFTAVQARLISPSLALMGLSLDLQAARALFERIFEYLDLEPAISDTRDARRVEDLIPGVPSVPRRQPESIAQSKPRIGRIDFEEVSFRYPGLPSDAPMTLDAVSFTIEAGQFAAFVGSTGAGKTTISYLIPRLYEASSGTVRFCGADVRSLKRSSLTAHIGFVGQETFLFHASIADNLRYAKPDASSFELQGAARRAGIHKTIMSFPERYETIVGERGLRLSGGERQRIAIARTLLKDPPVLILDEATSALDAATERAVQSAIDEAGMGRTTVAIAHRITTVMKADVIFVVDQGTIIDFGTHDALLSRQPLYANLLPRDDTRD